MYKTLTINNGLTTVLTATTNPSADPEAVVIIDETGWDGFSNISVETEPKLIGAGSYIVAEKIGDREIGFTFNLLNNVRTLANSLESLMFGFADLTFQMEYFNEGSSTVVETKTLNGKLTSLDIPRGFRDWGDIQITALCPNPIKQ